MGHSNEGAAGGSPARRRRPGEGDTAILHPDRIPPGRFCWLDLAATDAARARRFYEGLFGWTSHEQRANGGVYTTLRLDGQEVGSLYQLRQSHRDGGVPSHWTPYVRVDDADDTVRRAAAMNGAVIVPPFAVSTIARVALIQDPVGAQLGLWEPT